MSTDAQERSKPPLREGIAEEVLALLGRRRMSQIELARRIGKSHTYVGRRLNGETAFDTDDLEKIAGALGVSVVDLLPASAAERMGVGDVVYGQHHTSKRRRATMLGETEIRGRMPVPAAMVPDRPSDRRGHTHPGAHRPPSGPGRTARITAP